MKAEYVTKRKEQAAEKRELVSKREEAIKANGDKIVVN